jgi:hypothetical protein
VVEKSQQKNHGRKIAAENMLQKNVAAKAWKNNCNNKTVTTEP